MGIFNWKKFPYTNFHDLNLDYFINKFEEIFSEWENLYNTMLTWKDETNTGLEEWKTNVENDLDDRESALRAELTAWKTQTETDISSWETATLNALNAWKDATTLIFENIRDSAERSMQLAEQFAISANASAENAYQYKEDAEEAAENIEESAGQIANNTNDISDLKGQVKELNTTIFGGNIIVITNYVQGTKRLDGSENLILTRCSTANLYSLVEGDKISISNVDNGLKAAIVGTNGNEFISASGWQTSDYTYTVTSETEGRYFVSVAKIDDTQNLSPSEINTLKVIIGDTTYNAIEQLTEQVENLNNVIFETDVTETSDFVQGGRTVNGSINPLSTRCTTENLYALTSGNKITISNIDSGLKAAIIATTGTQFLTISGYQTEDYTYTVTSATEALYFVNVSYSERHI